MELLGGHPTLPKGHLLRNRSFQGATTSVATAHRAPMAHMTTAIGGGLTDVEVIDAFTIAPWHFDTRNAVRIGYNRDTCASECSEAKGSGLQLFTNVSQRNGLTGYSVVVWMEGQAKSWRQRTIGRDDQVRAPTAELATISEAVDGAAFALTKSGAWQRATVYSDSKRALQTITDPEPEVANEWCGEFTT